jgi:hypothetical protein
VVQVPPLPVNKPSKLELQKYQQVFSNFDSDLGKLDDPNDLWVRFDCCCDNVTVIVVAVAVVFVVSVVNVENETQLTVLF